MRRILPSVRYCTFEAVEACLALIGSGLPGIVLRERDGCRAHQQHQEGAMD